MTKHLSRPLILAAALFFGLVQWSPAAAQFSDSWEFLKALKDGDYEEMRNRIGRGANINIADDDGLSGLMLAAIAGDMKLMTFVIEQGGDVNVRTLERQDTVMMRCAEVGQTECIRLLLDAGADPDLQNRSGETALMRAVRARKSRAIATLLDAGVDIDKADYTGRMAIDYARDTRSGRIIKMLEDAGAR